MQTIKAIFVVLICISLLNACGLRGPLYLPEDEASEQATAESQTDEIEEETKKDSNQDPGSIQ